jgi:WD40 repeat protein
VTAAAKRDSVPPFQPVVGRSLGGFVVREKIGHGGQGAIYRADQPALGRDAIVKVLDPRGRVTATAIARFLREARLASMLDHPFAAHVYAAGNEPDGLLWIAMEHVRGTPLDRLVKTGGPVAVERFVPFLERLCQVVHTAHEQGLVHRDIKPANVMVVSRAGRLLPKLLDFGVAMLAADPDPADDAVIGSPAYMAPEQWIDPRRADAATDLYQLGVSSFEALTGRRPFDAPSLAALAHAHAVAPVPPLPAHLPSGLDAVFARVLAKRPEDRFESALAFAAAVRDAAGTHAAAALPQVDEPVRDALIRLAPQPLADAVAALEAARDPRAAWQAIAGVVAVAARWLGVLALAGRGRIAAPADPAVHARLAELRAGRLDDAGWLALASALCRPFADKRDAFPIPELVALLVTEGGDARDPFAALFAVRRAARTRTGEAEDHLADHVAAATTELTAALRAIAFVQDYPLAIAHDRGVELWTGVTRSPRAARPLAGAPLPDGTVVVLSAEGAPVLELSPLVQVAPPSPGLPREMFFLDAGGRRGARLVAHPTRCEREDDRPWAWLAERGLGCDPDAGDAGAVDARPPWRGLATLQVEDAALFVGREREVEAAVNRLRSQPLLAVVGPSGAGKSSFVQAGVLPALAPRWAAVTVRPGPSPWAALRARLAREDIEIGDGADPDRLGAALRAAGPIVLVVDQLEELFTLGNDADGRARYVDALARAARAADDDVRVVVTLRDDFLVRLAELPGLRDRLAVGLQIVTTPARPELLRILTEPARRTGYAFDDPALPGQMVDAVAEAPGALALLAFTATRLWELRDRQLKHLSRRAYDAIGGVGGALARHAEDTIDALTEAERRLAREVFRHVVTGAGTRAVLTRSETLELLGGGGDAERVVERLVGARLLHAGDAADDADRIEVIHEALLSAWPRLVQWRREDADGARLRDELRAAARTWRERGEPRGLLWRDEALAEYRLWRARGPGAITGAEAAFAAASLALAERGRRRRRVALAAGFAVVSAFAILQLVARRDAQDHRARAEERLVANYVEHARRLSLDDDPVRALAYAAEARRLGARGAAIDYLLARTIAGLSRQIRSADAGGRVLSMSRSTDGATLVTAGADGTARLWDADGAARATCTGHDQPVYRAELSPDGATLVTASWDGTARLWDARTCAPRASLLGHAGRVFWAGFSPDGRRVFTTGTDGTVRIWDTATGGSLHILELGAPAFLAAFSPDGTRLVASSPEPPGAARLWSMPDGALVAELGGGPVQALAFAPAGERLLIAGTDRAVRVVDARAGAEHLVLAHPQAVAAAVWSPDGTTIATGDEIGVVRIWDAATGALRHEMPTHAGRVTSLALSPDGARLASGGMDGRALVWDARSGAPLAHVHGHTDAIAAVAFVDESRRLATAGWDHALRLWDVGSPDATALAETAAFAQLDASGALAIVGAGRAVAVWDAATGAPRCTHTGHTAEVAAAATAPDATRLASGDAAGVVRIWDAARCALAVEIPAHTGPVHAIGFAPDGDRVVTAGEDGAVRVWDAGTGAAIGAIDAGAPIRSAGFSPDGATIYAVPRGGYVTGAAANAGLLYDAGTLERLAVLGHRRPLARLEIAADGRVLTVSRDGTAAIWRARSGVAETRFAAQAGGWFDAGFDPDGRRVVTCGQDPEASIWDARTGARIGALTRHTGFVLSCAFSPDGRYVITASTDGTARVWDAATFAPLDVLTLAAAPDPLLWPGARFAPRGGILTWTRSGQVRLWRRDHGQVEAAAIDRVLRCRIPWRVRGGVLVPAATEAGC